MYLSVLIGRLWEICNKLYSQYFFLLSRKYLFLYRIKNKLQELKYKKVFVSNYFLNYKIYTFKIYILDKSVLIGRLWEICNKLYSQYFFSSLENIYFFTE